jgi:single-strand DNA-binding protein
MPSVNMVVLGGRLGADPEERKTAAGMSILTFRIATNRWDAKAGAEVTDWYSVVAFDKEADRAAKVLKKGVAILIEGRLQVSEWTDKEGKKSSKVEVIAYRVNVLSYPKRDSLAELPEPTPVPAPAAVQPPARGSGRRDYSDSIPF